MNFISMSIHRSILLSQHFLAIMDLLKSEMKFMDVFRINWMNFELSSAEPVALFCGLN